jgi:hypothetical protein
MGSWERARNEMLNQVGEMEKLIPGYSYSDKANALNTDEKLCELIVNRIRESKDKLFHVIQFLYESNVEERLDKDLQRLRDELDIFSDEIKVRYCEWKVLTVGWIKKIISHDIDLVRGAEKLNSTLDELLEQALKLEKVKVDHIIQKDPKFWEKMERKAGNAEKQTDELVRLFKEREAICNIKAVDLEKTYEKIREEIRKKI